MAAGPQNGSRKRYSNHSEEENYSYKKRFDRSELQKSSDGRNGDHRRNRFGSSVHQFGHELHDRKLVDRNREHNVSEKKRKFSPILLDKVEKQQVRISSKNRIQDVEDAGIKQCSVADDYKQQISSVESVVSNVSDETSYSMVTRTPEEHDQDQEHEDGEFVEERKLSKSKWAFNDSPRKAQDDNNSSPESGEFKREGSEGNDDVSSLSSEDQQPVNLVDNKVSSDGYISSENDDDDDDDCEDKTCVGFGMMPSCRNVFEYERLGKISEGTYGVVYKARDKKTGEIVALKKVKMGKERDGFPITALREINILRSIQHPSVVELKEVAMDDFNEVYMVMEYIDNELKGYMDRIKQPFSQSEVKRLMIQLLEGLSYIHDDWVIHRDLKTSNLLLNKKGELKICDFGMARTHGSPTKACTSLVVTLWYRAPELLLGMKNYTTAIDMWSVGCIMAELLSKKPLFDGNRELEQIDKIFRTLGTPNDSIWPGYFKLPGVKSNFVKQPVNCLRKKFPLTSFTGAPWLTELGFDLLSKLLTYDPKKRITAKEALNHGWFRESPLPADNVRVCK